MRDFVAENVNAIEVSYGNICEQQGNWTNIEESTEPWPVHSLWEVESIGFWVGGPTLQQG